MNRTIQSASVAQGQRVAPTAGTRRLGIGGKLLAAFGAIAALTVAATVVAWILFANIRENLAIIADESLPEIASSFRLAEESARISASIPQLITAESPSDLAAMKEDLGVRLDAIEALTEIHAGHEQDVTPIVHELQQIARTLRSRIERLELAVQSSLSARQKRDSLLDALSSEHKLFIDALDPIIEAIHQETVSSARRSVADGTARIAGLVDEGLETHQGVMKIRAKINLITAVLHQVAVSDDLPLIRDKRFAIVGPIADIEHQGPKISGTEYGQLFVDSADEILDFAVGSRSIFELRKEILAGNGQQVDPLERRLVAEVAELDKTHAAFLALGRQVLDSVDVRTLDSAANASREAQKIVLDIDEGIEKLETLLFIHSDTNQLFGLLGEAGTAIFSGDIEAFRLRFSLLQNRILEKLIIYESSEHDPTVRATVEAILAYGKGNRSIPSSRLSELEARENASVILAKSQDLASEMSLSAKGLVEEAERAGSTAELSTRIALSRGELILVGIAVLSLAAALLIAWLYVFRGIVRRLTSLSSSMLSIAKGDLDTEIVFEGGNDEITDMGSALVVFREDAFRRRQAEEALRESEQRMRLILATSPIGVGISRIKDGAIVYANERLAEQFDRSADDLVGSPAADLYADADVPMRLLERVEKDGSVRDAEVRSKKANGAEFWSLLSFFPIEYDGESAHLAWVYDITQRKHAEEELREAKDRAEKALLDLKAAQERLVQTEKMASLGQLTAGVAHEIKNPLNFVKNFAEISKDLLEELNEEFQSTIEEIDEEKQKETLEKFASIDEMLAKIKEHGNRANSIVQSMLSHSRQGPVTAEPTDLNALLEESLDLAYHAARAEDQSFNVTLERSLDPNVGKLELYSADLMRVFLNLIGNAFYATKKRAAAGNGSNYAPTVAISTKCKDDSVEVRVRDNGTGVPSAVKDKIFDPFFTTKPPGEGTGLGLSLSYETVVRQHRGWMDVSSQEGVFSEFTVTLPR
jgi:PAS domain S-box-containing protein